MNPLTLTLLARKIKRAFGVLPSGFPDEWQLLPRITVDANGWLQGAGVAHVPIHKSYCYQHLTTKNLKPGGVVWHTSDTNAGTAMNMAKRRVRPYDPSDKSLRQSSWHISIEQQEDLIVQMLPLTNGAFHAASETARMIKGLGWANHTTASIELISPDDKAFPRVQVLNAARVLEAITTWSGMDRKFAGITHAEIDPSRRSDPGKVWMINHMDNVLEYAYSA